MELTALGVWGGYPTRDGGTTAYLLRATDGFAMLLDCGSRAVTELEHELSPAALDAVVISHYHEDHIADLGVLRQWRQLQAVRPDLLSIYGHDATAAEFAKLTLDGVSRGLAYDVTGVNAIGPFDITFLRTVHPVVCYAMRIVERATGATLLYTGDTGYFDALTAFAKGADSLLADVYFFKDKARMPNHLSSQEAGEIARQAGVSRLILTHLPQVGSLSRLRDEAALAAGNGVTVSLAAPHESWTI